MHVVVTAGHVDHGKSTLVRALTGQEPDRLAEERRRGLTIELGYVWTELAGLPDGGEVAFVDVPGHQRFVTTALAGMGPVPVALLVVAADDPWMPQTAEHLAALDALGVDRGVVVVTRSDLADPAPILAAARRQLAPTSLAEIPDVVVSGRTGAGLSDLRRTLADVLAAVPVPDPGAPVRLWVDRRFHVRGAGTVVTGTLPAGTVRPGDLLEVAGRPGTRARVRGVEALDLPRSSVSGVARIALDLGGRAPDVARGDALVTPGAFAATRLVDVELVGHAGGAGDEDRPPRSPLLHVGSSSQQVEVRRVTPGRARLRLPEPLPLAVGDRGLLRDPGSRSVWGLRVLDPAPPSRPTRRAATPPSSRTAAVATEVGAADQRAAERLAAWFADAESFAAPTAEDLAALGLDDGTLVRLDRAGLALRVAPGVVLRSDATAQALARLAGLEQPFTTSAARQALGTSRRVALPLLGHLDGAGQTVRLADDRRRLRQPRGQ